MKSVTFAMPLVKTFAPAVQSIFMQYLFVQNNHWIYTSNNNKRQRCTPLLTYYMNGE